MDDKKMIVPVVILLSLVEDCASILNSGCPNMKMPLGAMTASLVKAFMTHIPSGWNLALELDVLFPLPNANFTIAHSKRKKLHHRQKKELWQRLENALSLHNLDGHACVLKSICEAKVHLAPPGKSLVHDILRAVFTVPEIDEGFREEFEGAYDEVLTAKLCEDLVYCPISLLRFLFSLKS